MNPAMMESQEQTMINSRLKTLASVFHLWLLEAFSSFQNGSIRLENASCKRRALIIEDEFKNVTFADCCKPSYL